VKAAASPLGDSAITVSFEAESSLETTGHVRQIAERIRDAGFEHVEEVVPAYTALTVFYDSLHTSYDAIEKRVLEECAQENRAVAKASAPRDHVIPVTYDGQDLVAVAEATRLEVDEVIAIHSSVTYTVDLLGFIPGFAFMSEIDSRLELPRRPQPRPRVAAGSVAIARKQTGIYPFDTPGGWHILGRTSVRLFDPHRQEPSLFRSGDRVRFARAK